MTTSTDTLGDLIARHDVDVLDHLDREVTVPVLTGMQRQGDVLVVPADMANRGRTPFRSVVPATTPVPLAGIPVVRGENGGNTHAIVAEGDVRCNVINATATELALATLTVAEGATAYLTHPEHGMSGIGPGTYELRRQREQADELRLVAD